MPFACTRCSATLCCTASTARRQVPNIFCTIRSTMTSALTHCLALMVLLHATLGCCLHHAHACAEGCCEMPSPKASECGCDHHEGMSNQQPTSNQQPISEWAKPASGDATGPHGRHRCDGDACQFSAGSFSERGSFKVVGLLGSLPEPAMFPADIFRGAEQRWLERVHSPELKLPLLHCALLI